MKIFKFTSPILLSLFLFCCKSSEKKSIEKFYPFPQYLMDQLTYIDSMPFAIFKWEEIDSITTDSTIIDKANFKNIITPFLSTDPNTISNRPLFKETSFEDLSLGYITFSIEAVSEMATLRRADIFLDPNTKKEKRLNIKIHQKTLDAIILRNLFWENNFRCMVVEEILYNNGKYSTNIQHFEWDKPLTNGILPN